MIIFKKVKMRNFFAVGNNPVEIDLVSYNRTCILGKNGSGKSSLILDSIVFALYGKPFRKTNKPQVVNSINASDCVVEIEFSIGNKEYKIIRGLKPNIFKIYCDNVLINPDAAAKDYQDYLEVNILKINYKSFINIVILGSSRYNPFMQMPAAERRFIIEELLDIQIFSSMNIIAKDKLIVIKEQAQELKYKYDLTQEKITLQEDNLRSQKEVGLAFIHTKNLEVQKSQESIKALQKDIDLIQKHISILEEKIADKASLQKKFNSLNTIEGKLDNTVKKVNKELDFYKNNSNCPTCKQNLQVAYKQQQIGVHEQKLSELLTAQEKLKQEQDSVNSLLTEVAKCVKIISDHRTEVVRLNASIDGLQKYIKNLKQEIKVASEKQTFLEDDNTYLDTLKYELADIVKKQKVLLDEKQYYDAAVILLKDGGIKSRLIKQYIPILNKLINKYLSTMDFSISFNLDEKFNEIIKSRGREEFLYENFSNGEKTKIDLAILFAFRQIAKIKNSVNTNLFILDEILDGSLDSESVEMFFSIVDALDHDSNVFIISHRHEISPEKFDRILRFEKVKNFSRVKSL